MRRAFLTGLDPVSGKNYEGRREWIRARMECLASVLAIDVLTYAILSSHLHVILRTRPDVDREWSEEESVHEAGVRTCVRVSCDRLSRETIGSGSIDAFHFLSRVPICKWVVGGCGSDYPGASYRYPYRASKGAS